MSKPQKAALTLLTHNFFSLEFAPFSAKRRRRELNWFATLYLSEPGDIA